MNKYKISFDFTTQNPAYPKWILETINNELYEGESVTNYVCEFVGESTFNVSFDTEVNGVQRPDWIIISIDEQLYNDEFLLNVSSLPL